MEKIIHLPSAPPAKKPPRPKNTMPDGRKRVRLDVGTDPEGKRIRKVFTGKTLKEAREKRDAWIAAQKSGQAAAAPKSVADWATTWRAVYGSSAGYSQNTTVAIDVRRLCAYMGAMRLSDVQQVHLQAYAQTVAGYSKSTVNKIRITTNRIFEAAVSNGFIQRNPCQGVRWQNAGEGSHRFLEPWEIQAVTLHYSEHHAGLWALLMLYAGLRRGEALALRWEDVDLAAGVIHIRQGVHFEANAPVSGAPKTPSAVRDVPIFPQLLEALGGAARPCAYVCTSADGKPVTSSAWSRGWAAWNHAMQRAAGRLFDVRAHDLRHTFASLLYDAGVDLKTAQKLLGHASPEITMRIYTHLSKSRESASIAKMEAYLKNLGHELGHKSAENLVK